MHVAGHPAPINDRAAGKSYAWRVAMFFGALFLIYGVHVPYLPVWLDWRGLSPAEISAVTATPYFLRLIITPGIGLYADRIANHRLVALVLAFAGFLSVLALGLVNGFWPVFACAVLFAIAIPSIMPLAETVAIAGVRSSGLDYGRMRLWGSLTFIAATFAAGAIVDWSTAGVIIWLMLAGAASTVAAAYLLPTATSEATGSTTRPTHFDFAAAWRLAKSPIFLAFLIAAGAAQGAHATFYTFGAIHWREQGISAAWIGSLWAIGVFAEIALFAWSGAVLKRFGPGQLLLIGAVASVIRWTIMTFEPGLVMLVPLQVLHGLTFGAAHLGAIHFIARAVPAANAGAAQALYATFASGVALGTATLLAGAIYPQWAGGAYLAMAALSATGVVAALFVLRRWHGGSLGEPAADVATDVV